jgi:hypothetical protein
MINYSSSIKISQLSTEPYNIISPVDFIPIVNSGSLTTYRVSLYNVFQAMLATSSISLDTNLIFASGSALTSSNSLSYNYNSSALTVSGSINAYSVTASFNGTASNSISASYALTASTTLSSNTSFANSSSYVSGSQGTLSNLYLNLTGQKTYPFFHSATDSGIYLSSNTLNFPAYAEIYLGPTSSATGSSDLGNGVGLWLNGGYISSPNSPLPMYFGGNPNNTVPSPSIAILSNGCVGINTIQPTYQLHVSGTLYSTNITSSLYGTASWASNVVLTILDKIRARAVMP